MTPASWTLVPRQRLIIDNDWAGDPDGLLALAHHLLSPTDDVRLLTGTFIPPIFPGSEDGAARGVAFAAELVTLLGGFAPAVAGPESAEQRDENLAASAIVDEARRNDPLPLVLVCAGPLTNVAAALRLLPQLGERARLVWVGGSIDPAFEYNREMDRRAHDEVFAMPGLSIDQIPLETYRQVRCSVTELQHRLEDAGDAGRWIWRRFAELPIPDGFPLGETWALGDSLPLLATALQNDDVSWIDVPTTAGATVRHLVLPDARLLIEDFFAKLAGR